MITRLELQNFKAFEKLDLPLGKITLFLGPNNAGKSSLLAGLRLMGQTLQSADPGIPLLLDGVFGDFGTYRDLVYLNHRGRPFTVKLTAVTNNTARRPPPRSREIEGASLSVECTFKYRTKLRELVLRESKLELNGSPLLSVESMEGGRHLLNSLGGVPVPGPLKNGLSQTLRMNHFLPNFFGFRRQEGTKAAEFLSESLRETAYTAGEVSKTLWTELLQMDYLGAMRSAPERTYLYTGERRQRIGRFGEHASGILALEQSSSTPGPGSLVDKVSQWLSLAGIGSHVEVTGVSERHYELRVKHPITRETQNIADVGFGHSQVIPVLVGGYSLSPGSTFLVEQPEIHLHPKAQAFLADFMIDLANKNVQCVFETHSEHLVLRLQQYVAAGHVDPNDVYIYYVYPTKEGKQTKRIEMDSAGKFVEEWPEGFFPERLSEAKNLARIRHGKLELKLPTRH